MREQRPERLEQGKDLVELVTVGRLGQFPGGFTHTIRNYQPAPSQDYDPG